MAFSPYCDEVFLLKVDSLLMVSSYIGPSVYNWQARSYALYCLTMGYGNGTNAAKTGPRPAPDKIEVART
jgi:hypothetical protein